MALAMSHHNAYTAGERTSGTPHNHNHYPGDGGEPGPAPTLVDLMARVVEGRIDSDPQVAYEKLGGFCTEMICLLGVGSSGTCTNNCMEAMVVLWAVRANLASRSVGVRSLVLCLVAD